MEWKGRCYEQPHVHPVSQVIPSVMCPSAWSVPSAPKTTFSGEGGHEGRRLCRTQQRALSPEDPLGLQSFSEPLRLHPASFAGCESTNEKRMRTDRRCQSWVCHKAGLHSPLPTKARIHFPQKRKSSLNHCKESIKKTKDTLSSDWWHWGQTQWFLEPFLSKKTSQHLPSLQKPTRHFQRFRRWHLCLEMTSPAHFSGA